MTYLIELQLKISLETPWHVGTGLSRGLVDRAIQRDARGEVYIPASTVKGRLRNACEDLARLYSNEGNGLSPCQPPRPDRMCRGLNGCIVCSVFGSAYLGERLYVENARMSAESREVYVPGIQAQPRTRVKLDRRLRTVEHGHLFTSEYGERSLVFEAAVSGRMPLTPINQDPIRSYELVLLAAGAGLVKELGGDKSSGFGKCAVSVNGAIRVRDKEISATELIDMINELEYYGIG